MTAPLPVAANPKDAPLTQPPLTPLSPIPYLSIPNQITRVVKATWILLLILGCLHFLFVVFMGAGFVMLLTLMRRSSGSPGMPTLVMVIFFGIMTLFFAIGASHIFCSLKIRNRSYRAAMFSLVVVTLELTGVIVIVALGILDVATSSGRTELVSVIFGFVFYGIVALTLATVGLLLFKSLKDLRVSPM